MVSTSQNVLSGIAGSKVKRKSISNGEAYDNRTHATIKALCCERAFLQNRSEVDAKKAQVKEKINQSTVQEDHQNSW